jgi:hypothetical protein
VGVVAAAVVAIAIAATAVIVAIAGDHTRSA